jgi:hypothetical protein
VAGIADAVAYEAQGRIEVIVDWNSDVDIDAGQWNSDFGQLGAYQRRTGVPHAWLALRTMQSSSPRKPAARRAGRRLSTVRLS